MNELRFAALRLWNQPTFTAIAALTLALGIGGTTAVFSVVNGVLIKPLPYHDPDELVLRRIFPPAERRVSIRSSHCGMNDLGLPHEVASLTCPSTNTNVGRADINSSN